MKVRLSVCTRFQNEVHSNSEVVYSRPSEGLSCCLCRGRLHVQISQSPVHQSAPQRARNATLRTELCQMKLPFAYHRHYCTRFYLGNVACSVSYLSNQIAQDFTTKHRTQLHKVFLAINYLCMNLPAAQLIPEPFSKSNVKLQSSSSVLSSDWL